MQTRQTSPPPPTSSTKFCGEKTLPDDLAFLTAQIHSRTELQEYLAAHRKTKSAFNYFTRTQSKKFLASLIFNDNGLVSYRTDVVEENLTPSQAYQLLALFGVQRTVGYLNGMKIESSLDREILESTRKGVQEKLGCSSGQDYKNYYCNPNKPHTCSPSTNDICMSGC